MTRKRQANRRRCFLEALETRQLMAADLDFDLAGAGESPTPQADAQRSGYLGHLPWSDLPQDAQPATESNSAAGNDRRVETASLENRVYVSERASDTGANVTDVSLGSEGAWYSTAGFLNIRPDQNVWFAVTVEGQSALVQGTTGDVMTTRPGNLPTDAEEAPTGALFVTNGGSRTLQKFDPSGGDLGVVPTQGVPLGYQDFSGSGTGVTDTIGHGTHVSSTIGSQSPSHLGIAPGADIIQLKVIGDLGYAEFAWIESALQWVINNADAYNIASVNMSLGAGNFATPASEEGLGDELAALAAMNIIVSSAAGNSFPDFGSTQGVAYPAADPNSLAIGAVWDGDNGGPITFGNGATDYTTGADRLTSFTQRHQTMTDVFAPGALIEAGVPGGGTANYAGTSMAAPHVAGITVLAQQLATEHLGRRFSMAEFRDLLATTSVVIHDGDDEDDNVFNTNLDYKRVDVMELGSAIWAMGGDATNGDPAVTVQVDSGQTATANFGVRQDAQPVLVSIGDRSLIEGNADTRSAQFQITLSEPSSAPVTVTVDTFDGTAIANQGDYTAITGLQLTFAPGETHKQVVVDIHGDTQSENDETYQVQLSNVSGADIDDAVGDGLLLDDDKGPYQTVQGPESVVAAAANPRSLPVTYGVSDGNTTLVGLGLRVHYDSSLIETLELGNVLASGLIAQQESLDDTQDFDGDLSTDKYYLVAWADSMTGAWPDQALPSDLFNLNFKLFEDVAEGTQTNIRFSAASTAAGYDLLGSPINIISAPAVNLDVDGNGRAEALTDGVLIQRYLFGFTGDQLVQGVVDTAGTRTDPAEIISYLDDARHTMLDVDANGSADALTDGTVIVRYLLGMQGADLARGAVDAEGGRVAPDQIQSFLDGFMAVGASIAVSPFLAPASEPAETQSHPVMTVSGGAPEHHEPVDVDHDGSLSANDLQLVMDAIAERGPQRLTGADDPGAAHDTNRDGFLSPIDALLIVNRLNDKRSVVNEPAGEAQWGTGMENPGRDHGIGPVATNFVMDNRRSADAPRDVPTAARPRDAMATARIATPTASCTAELPTTETSQRASASYDLDLQDLWLDGVLDDIAPHVALGATV